MAGLWSIGDCPQVIFPVDTGILCHSLVMVIRPKPKPPKREKKKKPVSRRKKTRRQILELRADRLVREIVLARDADCVCLPPKNGHSDVMQPGHLISRGRKAVRWSLWNVHKQCSSCNLLHEFFPEKFTKWFIEEFGESVYMVLVDDSDDLIDCNTKYLERMVAGLEEVKKHQIENPKWKPYLNQEEIIEKTWRKENESS